MKRFYGNGEDVDQSEDRGDESEDGCGNEEDDDRYHHARVVDFGMFAENCM